MGPRPLISAFATGIVSTNLQCGRYVHTRTLGCQTWEHGSRRPIQPMQGGRGLGQTRRHKSSAAGVASQSQYGRESPPPAQTSKTNPPAKPTDTPSHRVPSPPALQSKESHVPFVRTKERLNPPYFTHAPSLDVPARKTDQGFLSYIWKAGRSYLSFYKSGVKNVRQTSKLARTLREKVTKAAPRSISDVLTRAEWQIVQRSRKDMLRLPAFGAIFLIFGEWTPLLVMYITPLIPEPCRIPSQVARDLAKTERTRHERMNMRASAMMRLMDKDRRASGAGGGSLPTDLDVSKAKGIPEAEAVRDTNVLELSHLELFIMSARYNCHGRIWDWVFVMPPKFWLQRNVRKKFEYLRRDDELIARDGGFHALEKGEVERACVERGLDVLGKREDDVRRELAKWFNGGPPARTVRAR